MPNLTFYSDRRLEKLLAKHGPKASGNKRNTADKINYMVNAYDYILSEERNAIDLTGNEWGLLFAATSNYTFSMENGGPIETDFDACLSCLDIFFADKVDLNNVKSELLIKLKSYSIARKLALVWKIVSLRGNSIN